MGRLNVWTRRGCFCSYLLCYNCKLMLREHCADEGLGKPDVSELFGIWQRSPKAEAESSPNEAGRRSAAKL